MIHLIFLSPTWKVWEGELPEKPRLCDLPYDNRSAFFRKAMHDYNEALAAIKRDAVEVQNPEILKQFDYLALTKHGDFIIWPGSVEYKKIGRGWHSTDIEVKTVAILKLPEEKPHEFRDHADIPIIVNKPEEKSDMKTFDKFSLYKDHPTTASGDVAKNIEEYKSWLNYEDVQKENEALKKSLTDLLEILNSNSYYLHLSDKDWYAIDLAKKLLQ